MKRIREILLAQYIGAITIGLILAQAFLLLVSAIVQSVATYLVMQDNRSVLGEPRSFSWTNISTSMVTVFLYLLICFLLVRWLYFEPEASANSPDEEIPNENEP